MAITAFKSWSSGEILTAADLNSSFSQIINNPIDLWSPSTKAMDLGGFALTNGGSAAFTTLSTSGLATLASATVTATATAAAFVPSGAGVPTNGLYLKAANNPALSSNTTLRWDVNSTGNHAFAAPSSGVAATIATLDGVASVGVALTNGTTVPRIQFTRNAIGSWQVGGPASAGNGFEVSFNASAAYLSISTAGNVTIPAPSSGVALAVTAAAGGAAITATDGTVSSLVASYSGAIHSFGTTSAHTLTL